jgi:hypothetical protein
MADYPNPFDGVEVISSYSDSEAVEDGTLVAINPKDRVTRTVWEHLVQHAPKGSKPPDRWPVDMMTWFRAEAIKREDALKLIAEFGKEEAQKKFERMIADRKVLALSKGIVSTHTREANRVYEENVDGGIYKWTMFDKVAWLLPNENGGITLMFPEDY